jgi:hypothetical protein
MRRYLPVTLVSAGLVLGSLCLLLALDVSRAAGTVGGDDARFLAQPRIAGYWEDDGVLPFGAGRRLLGAGDDVAQRRAVQRFWLAQPRDPSIPGPERLAARAQAQAELAEAEEGADAEGASLTANLLGVLALLTPPDQAERSQVVRAAGAAFRRAIVLDQSNDDAKFNLESVLRLVADERNRGQGGGGSAGQEGTEFGGAALSRRGTGY